MRAFTLSEAVELCRQRRGGRADEVGERRERETNDREVSFAHGFGSSQKESQWQTQ